MRKLQNAFWLLFSLGIFIYFIFKVVINSFTDHVLGADPQHIKAIIIGEKNYMGNQPVHPRFSYSYQFTIKGKKYTGNSHDTSLIPGDTIEVLYNRDHPFINKSLHPKE